MYFKYALLFLTLNKFVLIKSNFNCKNDDHQECHCKELFKINYLISCQNGTEKIVRVYKRNVIYLEYWSLKKSLKNSDLIIYPRLKKLTVKNIFIGSIENDLLKGI